MMLGLLPALGGEAVTLQRLFALPFRPVMWLIGVPWDRGGDGGGADGDQDGAERVRRLSATWRAARGRAWRRTAALIMTFAMCGFANFGSVGIMVGGIAAMVPERRTEVAKLGLRSLVSGTIATCMSGAVAGLLMG